MYGVSRLRPTRELQWILRLSAMNVNCCFGLKQRRIDIPINETYNDVTE